MANPIPEWQDAFKFQVVNQAVNRLDVGGNYDFNIGRHRLVVNGTFIEDAANTTKFADQAGHFQITASGGDTITFGARELLRYVPNFEVLWGIAAQAASDLTAGQRVVLELADGARENAYRYEFGPSEIRLVQVSGGLETDVETISYERAEDRGWSLTEPFVGRARFNWYGAGRSEYAFSYPTDNGQILDALAETFNDDGFATERINLRPQVTVDLNAGASDLTVDIGSIGAAILGDAAQINRPKRATFWNLGGAISQYFTDNEAVVAGRIDPTRNNVAVQIPEPIVSPAGSDTIEVLVGTVHKDNAGLTVNFDDPDNDGTDEGPAPAAQNRSSTDVMQWTSDVTAYPTATDIRADFTTGSVPDVREVGDVIASGGGNNRPPMQSSQATGTEKRLLFPDDVVLFIPRTPPQSSNTSGSIEYLRIPTDQDW